MGDSDLQGPPHSRLSKRSSLEELLFYKGQPSHFYPARLKTNRDEDFDYYEGRRLMLRGAFFPSKLVKTFSMSQTLSGLLMILFGVVSILTDAALSYLGGGIWGGALVLSTGILGLLAAYRPSNSVRIVAFLIFSLFSIATCGLVIVLCATGLASDVNAPESFYVDDKGHPVLFLGRFSTTASAVACNGAILVVAILSCLVSLGSCVLSAREACQCYGGADGGLGPYADRRDRLLNWLGQQAVLNSLPPSQPVRPPPPRKYDNQRVKPGHRQERPSCQSRLRHLQGPETDTSYTTSGSDGSPASLPKMGPGRKDTKGLEGAKSVPVVPEAEYLAVDRKMAEEYIEKLLVDERKFVALGKNAERKIELN